MTAESRKIDIKSLSQRELVEWFKKLGEKSFRADQVLKWIYQHQCDNFDVMGNINKKLINSLKKTFTIERLRMKSVHISSDGSKKYAYILSDNNVIETLLIPEKKHFTLCVSSQVGCAQKCKFCMTGKRGLVRNLDSKEIIAQIRDMKREVQNQNNMPLSNIVFMGMGEPLANYKQVIKALKIISNECYGLQISPRHITISTSGLVPKIKALGIDTKVNLAISLNATNNKTRNILMPINKIYPIETLLDICRVYPLEKRRRITFEYVLIKGINDRKSDAEKLSILLKDIKSKINLIPLNEHSKCVYKSPSKINIIRFQKYLLDRNYTTIVRYSKGKDISGACGQLSSKYVTK